MRTQIWNRVKYYCANPIYCIMPREASWAQSALIAHSLPPYPDLHINSTCFMTFLQIFARFRLDCRPHYVSFLFHSHRTLHVKCKVYKKKWRESRLHLILIGISLQKALGRPIWCCLCFLCLLIVFLSLVKINLLNLNVHYFSRFFHVELQFFLKWNLSLFMPRLLKMAANWWWWNFDLNSFSFKTL